MPQESYWRIKAHSTIAYVWQNLPADADLKTVRKAFYDNYPFGERKYLPYRIWCEECRKTLERWKEMKARERGEEYQPPAPRAARRREPDPARCLCIKAEDDAGLCRWCNRETATRNAPVGCGSSKKWFPVCDGCHPKIHLTKGQTT